VNEDFFLTAETCQEVAAELRRELHFYHITPQSCLASIKATGLDISKSHHDFRDYGEPKVMRYCLKSFVGDFRSIVQNQYASITGEPAPVSVLRVPSSVLLARRFGLDWSFGNAKDSAMASWSKATVSALNSQETLDLIYRYGVISCFETIPPSDIESSIDGVAFLPLSQL
jgi:hypothetical protein